MADLHDLSALDLAAALRRGETSAAEVLDHTLRRAGTVGAAVGAFAVLTPDLAAAQATAADAALARGDDAPFLGVPVPIKDLAMVAGQPFEAGSLAMRGFRAQVDDGVVTLLREAGTVMVGKTTTPEFGLPAYTEPATGAPARTPWDLTRTAGGSSGGAAAAVAAGVVPAAHGSDGGGSLRIPAACCGVVGMKPSRGRVSPGPHRVEGIGLVTDGVLTRTVRDSAALLDVLARPWPGDSCGVAAPASSFLAACDAAPAPLRVGVLTEPLNTDDAPVHPEALAAVARAARLLEGLGHHVDAAPRAMTGEDWMAFMPLWATGAAQLPLPPEAEEVLMPLTRWLRALGRATGAVEYASALTRMQQVGRQIAGAWADFDVILTPTLAQPPLPPAELQLPDPAADFEAQKRFTPWTSVWNMTGAPAISLPLHRAGVGGVELPFGVMLGGVRPGQEETLFALAAALESADPWPLVREPGR
ncbi:MAG: amidase [Actinomycetales bacterium]|nr:amidase [Actinomycetales bacterium]